VPVVDTIRAVIPRAIEWLAMSTTIEMPPGSLGNDAAAQRVAELVEVGAGDGLREHLMYFAIKVGARRLSDTADCLLLAGYDQAARIAAEVDAVIGATARMAPARCNPNRPCRRCRMAVTSDAEARGCGAVAIWCAAPPS